MNGRYVTGFFLIFIALSGCYIYYSEIQKSAYETKSASAQATVTAIDSYAYPRRSAQTVVVPNAIEYEYTVGGISYTGHTIVDNSWPFVPRKGGIITIKYNRGNPQTSQYMPRNIDISSATSIRNVSCFFGVLGVAFLVGAMKRNRP